MGNELQAELIATSSNTVGAGVVSAIKTALFGTGLSISADGGIPFVPGVAVGATFDGVSPSPVGVNDNGALDSRAPASGAFGPAERRMSLGSRRADLLGAGSGDQRRSCGNGAVHDEKKESEGETVRRSE